MDDDWQPYEEDGFIGLVGSIQKGRIGDGKGHFRFIPEDRHRNRNGVVHGGMLMTFADRALGDTARQGDAGRKHATAQLDVHFVSAAKIGAVVDLRARVIRETRNMVFVEGELTSEGRIVATAKGIWAILSRGD